MPLSTESLFASGKQGSVVNRVASKLALERSQRRAVVSFFDVLRLVWLFRCSLRWLFSFARPSRHFLVSSTLDEKARNETKNTKLTPFPLSLSSSRPSTSQGSQTLPRSKSSPSTEVHTIVPTLSYPVDQTKRILAKCKKEGVSVSNAVFGLVGVAWARLLDSGKVKGRVEEPL